MILSFIAKKIWRVSFFGERAHIVNQPEEIRFPETIGWTKEKRFVHFSSGVIFKNNSRKVVVIQMLS